MQQPKQLALDAGGIQRIFNMAAVTIGGVYIATHSIAVTAIATAASTP